MPHLVPELLPDFFFHRIPDLETEYDFGLGGHLYSNIPRRERQLDRYDGKRMDWIMRRLAREVAAGTDLQQASIWNTDEGDPDVKIWSSTIFDARFLRVWRISCYVAEALIDPDDLNTYVVGHVGLPPGIH